MARRANGEGSIWRRQDGRRVGSAYARISGGGRKRVHIYARTRAEARERLTTLQRDVDRGVTVPAQSWALGDYLQHWLTTVVRPNRMPKTYQGYELAVRNHIVPVLGRKRLSRLSVTDVRTFVEILNEKGLGGCIVQTFTRLRNALESALRRARRSKRCEARQGEDADLRRWSRADDRASPRASSSCKGRPAGGSLCPRCLPWSAPCRGARRSMVGRRSRGGDAPGRADASASRRCASVLPPKTKHSKRTVPLPTPCVDALRFHRVARTVNGSQR